MLEMEQTRQKSFDPDQTELERIQSDASNQCATIRLSFNERLNPISAANALLFSLVSAGPDGVFGEGVDLIVPIAEVSYAFVAT